MKNKDFDLTKYDMELMTSEVSPLIERALIKRGEELTYFKFIEVTKASYVVLAISKSCLLWRLEFNLDHPENREINPVQNSSRLEKCEDLEEFCNEFQNLHHLSDKELHREMLLFFINTPEWTPDND